jgi:hypothetical protein
VLVHVRQTESNIIQNARSTFGGLEFITGEPGGMRATRAVIAEQQESGAGDSGGLRGEGHGQGS